ncbi:MAG: sigma-70 family RNA polymerase sigma factor [Myxococcota bacterium]
MEAAQAGDGVAYERLLLAVLPVLRQLVSARLGDPSSVEDVVQNVLFSIHRARHTFQPGRPFGPWMRAIARNAVVDGQRQRSGRLRRERPLSEAEEVEDKSEATAAAAPLSSSLRRALEALPPGQRQAVELIHLRELSVSEAAKRVGITPGALKLRAHRGYRALRALLGGTGE